MAEFSIQQKIMDQSITTTEFVFSHSILADYLLWVGFDDRCIPLKKGN